MSNPNMNWARERMQMDKILEGPGPGQTVTDWQATIWGLAKMLAYAAVFGAAVHYLWAL